MIIEHYIIIVPALFFSTCNHPRHWFVPTSLRSKRK